MYIIATGIKGVKVSAEVLQSR